MADSERTFEVIRAEIAAERAALATALETLTADVKRAGGLAGALLGLAALARAVRRR